MTPFELRGGLVVDQAALELYLALTNRGHVFTVRNDVDLFVSRSAELTAADKKGIRALKAHLIALARYEPPALEDPELRNAADDAAFQAAADAIVRHEEKLRDEHQSTDGPEAGREAEHDETPQGPGDAQSPNVGQVPDLPADGSAGESEPYDG